MGPPTPGPLAATPAPSEVEFMAYNRRAAQVHGILRALPPEERPRYASDAILTEAIAGGLARLRSVPPASSRLQQEERAFVADLLWTWVESCRRRRSSPRDLHRSLLDWGRQSLAEGLLDEARRACDEALDLGATSFPDLYPHVVLLRAEVADEGGDAEEGHALRSALYRRLDLVAGRHAVADLTLALARSALATGRPAEGRRVLFQGLRAFFTGLGPRRELVDLLARVHRGALRVLAADASAGDRLLFAIHWLCLNARRVVRAGVLARPFERGLLGLVYVLRYAGAGRGPGGRRPSPRVLVTRAMGGIGDLLMMTPGLHALRLAVGAPVDLAIPPRYFALFEGNDDVRLLDIAGDVDPGAYERWLNLTDCPAARVESRTAPRVRATRIDAFARGLGIRGGAFRRMERRLRYSVTAEEREAQRRWFAERGLAGRAVIGVQLRSDESYRDYAHMDAVVAELARRHPVLVFDTKEVRGAERPGVHTVAGYPLREAFALAAACDVLVAPDSSFVHLADAVGVPCVALFGPTHGPVRTRTYARAQALDASRELACVPCWRNEEIPCALTGLRASACMEAIPVEAVTAAVAARLAG
jgi:ADP-heptose:LPS heptosyltransferase